MMHQVYLSEISLLKTVKKRRDYSLPDLSAIDTKLLKDSIISEGRWVNNYTAIKGQ
jgi:hypothetical protein